jgi:glycosyltransferase involved in cell wall biosynthesis
MGDLSVRTRLGLIFINDEQWVGGTYYTINLIQALNVLNVEDKPEIVAFSNEEDFIILLKETQYPYLKYEPFEQVKLGVLSRLINKITSKLFKTTIFKQQYKGHLDALFIMQRSGYLESIPFEKRIYWIPDFQDKHYPEFFTQEGLAKKHERSKWIAENAKNIILSSEAVKRDWERFYPNYKGQTKVVHFAVTHPEYYSIELSEVLKKYDLSENYFFAPNQFWAHKNHIVVIKAVEILKKEGNPVIVAFSGKENDNRNPGYTEKLKAYVKENDLEDVVRFLGFLNRREQLKIMKHAKAVIQPSLFEGWSTVIEDAMAMNQRVIASDLEVNKEQLGEKGFFFEKNNPNDLVEKLKRIDSYSKVFDYQYRLKQRQFALNFFGLCQCLVL